jgi:hypothetical protein
MKGMLRQEFAGAEGHEVTLRLAGDDGLYGTVVAVTDWDDGFWTVRIVQQRRPEMPDLTWDVAGDAIVAVAWLGGAP